ncbi:MAG: Crp/Fnr family transcriptional regulator, partial [Myxococcota bacterium]
MFGTLDETEIDELIAASELLPVHAGQIVCEPGDPGDHVALVVHGCLAAQAPGPAGPAPLNHIRAGEIYGEMGVLRGAPRSARVTARENGELLIVCQAVFLSLLVRHPAISIRILGSVSDRL